MDRRVALQIFADVTSGRSKAVPLFSNSLRATTIADDMMGAVLLLLMAAPIALFCLVLPAAFSPPMCTEAPALHERNPTGAQGQQSASERHETRASIATATGM